jgi:hemoglobin
MYAFGGPNEYQGRDMHAAHHNMHLTEDHFNVIVEHFGSTLDELNVPKEVQQEVVQVVLATKDEIIGH